KSWHVTLANLGYFVIGLHAIAALMHHYFWKDNTLLRMMPRKRATSQQAYDEAVDKVFTALARLEQILGQHRYLTGDQLTEADIR
ncbi:glutathione S-transferase C-terminal domain-containing protein, partial [Salmonella enterica subsp. enterica serovar Anatum]|nr:glutathione S-transferase C-terminal domain-containing protein [Salmonella enterica subsp. enterica serovar Anatum]